MSATKVKTFEPPEKISGDQVVLKKLELKMAPIMFKYVDQDRERLEEFLPWVSEVRSVADEEDFIRYTLEQWKDRESFCYGIFDSNEENYLGNISVFDVRWKHFSCEIGYWIYSKFEGKGLMYKAVRALESRLFALGFHRLVIRCNPDNKRSVQLAKKLVYQLDGVMREDVFTAEGYRDTMVFSKLKTSLI